MTIYAPTNANLGSRQPYVTPRDCRESAILSAFDLTALNPGGDQSTQDAALAELIRMASAKVDDYLVGQFGALAATQNTCVQRVNVQPDGSLIVQPEFGPLLAVVSLEVGPSPAFLQPVTLSEQNTQVQRFRFIVTPIGSSGASVYGSLDAVLGGSFSRRGVLVYAQCVYVNGWPHAVVTAGSVAQGGTELPSLPNVLGWTPGAQGFVYDGAQTEGFTVASSYTPGDTPVPIVGSWQFAHRGTVQRPIIVSALPETIRTATMHFIADKLETRGQDGIVLEDSGGFRTITTPGAPKDHQSEAYDLLDAFKQGWSLPT